MPNPSSETRRHTDSPELLVLIFFSYHSHFLATAFDLTNFSFWPFGGNTLFIVMV